MDALKVKCPHCGADVTVDPTKASPIAKDGGAIATTGYDDICGSCNQPLSVSLAIAGTKVLAVAEPIAESAAWARERNEAADLVRTAAGNDEALMQVTTKVYEGTRAALEPMGVASDDVDRIARRACTDALEHVIRARCATAVQEVSDRQVREYAARELAKADAEKGAAPADSTPAS